MYARDMLEGGGWERDWKEGHRWSKMVVYVQSKQNSEKSFNSQKNLFEIYSHKFSLKVAFSLSFLLKILITF